MILHSYSLFLCCCDKNNDQGPTWRGKRLFHLKAYSPLWIYVWVGTQDRNLESGTEAETLEEPWQWLAWFGLLNLFYPITRDNLTRGGTAHGGWGSSPSIMNCENVPTDLTSDQSLGNIFLIEVPFSQRSLCRIDKQKQNNNNEILGSIDRLI